MATNQGVVGGQGNAMILAIGTAVPPDVAYQETYPDYYFRVTNTQHLIDLKMKFQRLCDKTMIIKRHFHLTEEILKKNPNMLLNMAPSFDARHKMLVTKIPELAKEAALKAIEEWKQPISKITHLIFCTTAGVDLPCADLRLMELLGLDPSVKRFMLSRQGCSAGMIALRLAKDLVENNPGARVLAVCSESNINGFRGPSPTEVDLLVSEALLADGASATIVGTQPNISIEHPTFEIVSASQMTIPGTGDKVKAFVREVGLLMYMSKELPSIVANNMQKCLNKAFDPYEISDWNSLFWIAHPGGPKILNLIESRLNLNKYKLDVSRHILSEYGNMASACVMFVMDEMRKRSLQEGKTTTGEGFEWGVLCGFGPGISVETIVLRSVPI